MNNETVKDMGVLAKEAYKNYSQNDPIDNLPRYKVLETQDSLLSPLYAEFFGFQAMLLEEQGTGKYVIAFRGTEVSGFWCPQNCGQYYVGKYG